MKNILIIAVILIYGCSKKSDQQSQTIPKQNTSTNIADTVIVTSDCANCPVMPTFFSMSLSGVLNFTTSRAYAEQQFIFTNVSYGTIYYSASLHSSVSGQFEVNASQKKFRVTVPN